MLKIRQVRKTLKQLRTTTWFIVENGKMIRGMAMGSKSFMTDLGLRDNGSSTNKHTEPMYGLTVLNTLETSAAHYCKAMGQ